MRKEITKLADLNGCIAKISLANQLIPDLKLTIIQPSRNGDYYTPAKDISVVGIEGILLLRDFLNEYFEEKEGEPA